MSFSDTVKLLFLICRLDNHFCSMNISDIVIFHKFDIVALWSLTYFTEDGILIYINFKTVGKKFD